VLHSFSNVSAAYRAGDMVLGTTHVAVGFLDLGNLAAACVELQHEAFADGGRPLKWVGYDMSAYCVAKSLVVLEMVRAGAKTDAVLQVCP
jgi:hypothetical protein